MNPLFYVVFCIYLIVFLILKALGQEWFNLDARLLSLCLTISHLSIIGAFIFFVLEYFFFR
jgi:hypothetical protein